MADYRFDKPWAAESQNVQDFTEQEWGTGIVEKSLVSSAQVNGVMQAVTKRFLDLEAVEDRQYRYDFIVENQAQWNKFINNNLGNAQSVLIRKGQVWTATNTVTLQRVGVIAQEEGAEIRFDGGLNRQSNSPVIISGGVVRGNLTNCRVLYATISNTRSASYNNTIIENSYVYTQERTVSLAYGHYSRSVLNIEGDLVNAKLVDCKINRVGKLRGCTLVRCEIPSNTKLTNCTLIDCDYTVDRFIMNCATGTTFRNCNISFTTTGTETGLVCGNSNKAYGSRITFTLSKSEHVSMLVYDSQIMFYRGSNTCLFTDSQFLGTSYMNVSGAADTDLVNIIDKMGSGKGCILTDIPFFRNGGVRFRTYNSTNDIYPGVVNKVIGNNDRTPRGTYYSKQKFFIQFTGNVSTETISYGLFKFIPWCRYSDSTPSQDDNYKDSYNIEFIIPETVRT